MFTVDLLKGQGLPIKSRPEGIATAVVAFAVPIIIAIVMLSSYLSNIILISTQNQRIVNYQTKIDKFSDALQLQRTFEKQKELINTGLSEVSSSLGRHTQWSPVLVELVQNMPDSMVLTQLDVKQNSVKKQVPKKNDPETMINIDVPVRTLHMSISGSPQSDWDKEVRDFQDRLRRSTLLGPKLENIKVAQEMDTLDGRDVVSYEIYLVFKPQS